MSWNARQVLSFEAITASDLGQYLPVKLNTASNSAVQLAATTTDDVVGVSLASSATYGSEVAVVFHGIVKVLCGASIGAGARVAVASTNGAVGPISASGIVPSLGPSAGWFPARYSIGRSLEAHAAGDYMPVLLDFTEIV